MYCSRFKFVGNPIVILLTDVEGGRGIDGRRATDGSDDVLVELGVVDIGLDSIATSLISSSVI
jgi:hypothetical protein